jgi:DNA polymerase I
MTEATGYGDGWSRPKRRMGGLVPKKLFLVDGSNQAFRAFFAIQTDMRGIDGSPTRALFGYANMLQKLIRENKPDYIAVVFDQGLSFRNELYPAYKGQRPDMPADLRAQWPDFIPFTKEWGITAIAQSGFEADDIIGTLATMHGGPDCSVSIVSSDKDFAQLVDDHVHLLDVAKGVDYGPDEVVAKWGVGPDGIIDLLALMGDKSDNVPGVAGVGPKTAVKLILAHGSAEDVVAAAGEGLIKGKTGERIAAAHDDVTLSKKLVTIVTDMDLSLSLDDLVIHEGDWAALETRLARYDFRRMLDTVRHKLGSSPTVSTTVDRSAYRTVQTAEDLAWLVGELRKAGRFAYDSETTSLDPRVARLVGMSFCWDEKFAVYVPIAHAHAVAPAKAPEPAKQLGLGLAPTSEAPTSEAPTSGDGPAQETADAAAPDPASADLALADELDAPLGDPGNCPGALDALLPLLADPSLKKTGQNLKYDLEVLRARGHELRGIDGDTMLADYLLHVDRKHGLDALATRILDHTMISYAEATEGVDGNFSHVPVEKAAAYAGEDAHVVWLLEKQMDLGPVESVYRDVELPLIPVLADMELAGIRADADALGLLSIELEQRISELVDLAHAEAGETFNLNSPKQLRVLLFEKRGLPVIKKTKTGASTAADVLVKLADGGDALCQLILDYRELAKLKGTYVDALPNFIADDGRIHSSFHQAVAATGRLSSYDPNLQNIPVRTAEGRRIRECFVAEPGHVFLSCDYSQVELRVLAHFCKDGPLVDAFREGQDIHRRTASEVFATPMDDVTVEQRRAAKAINFGIVYGMSAFRLANELSISRRDAQDYIDGYFARYPQVRAFMDDAIERARDTGYAETLLGRRRPVFGLDAKNPNERGAAERIAINTPVQGSAADLIKVAMIRVHARLRREHPDARLLLQVHDELVLEVPWHKVAEVRDAVSEEMRGVAELAVPLLVDSGTGRTWNEAH